MIAEKPKLVVGDVVIVYIRRVGPPTGDTPIVIKSKTVTSVGIMSDTWVFNHDTEEMFTYSEVEYILRKGKWRRA